MGDASPGGLIRRIGASLLLAAIVAAAWTQALDRPGLDGTQATLQRALAAFALARGLNGVISVAQGTEIAIQPVGVGVTLTVGEVLDPLNDLVEHFSWLALLACVSLGTQMLLAEVVLTPWINGALSVAALAYLAALWWPGAAALRTVLMRAFTLAVFARFLFAVITLITAWVDQTVLADRQTAALDQMEITQARIEALQEEPSSADPPAGRDTEPSVLERFGEYLDGRRQALDVQAQLGALTDRVESTIMELINLLVLFTVQTLLVPVLALLSAYWTFIWLWRWSWQPRLGPPRGGFHDT